MLLFYNSSEAPREQYITNCIFNEGNGKIDVKKILRENIIVPKNKSIETIQCSAGI
jgi:hypothetical protein